MPINPITAYRLVAQAEAAFAERDTARQFASDLNRANGRILADLHDARLQRDDLAAKIARMTSGLRQNVKA